MTARKKGLEQCFPEFEKFDYFLYGKGGDVVQNFLPQNTCRWPLHAGGFWFLD